MIIKTVAVRCEILRLKCFNFDFAWGSAPDPTAFYSTPPDPLAGFKWPTSKGREREGEKRGKEGRRGGKRSRFLPGLTPLAYSQGFNQQAPLRLQIKWRYTYLPHAVVCISGMAEWICARFTGKRCFVPRLEKFECQGQRGHQGQKTTFFCPFGGLHAVCVW